MINLTGYRKLEQGIEPYAVHMRIYFFIIAK